MVCNKLPLLGAEAEVFLCRTPLNEAASRLAFGISHLKPADSRESWGPSVAPGVLSLPLCKMPSLVQCVWLHWEWDFPGWILHSKLFLNQPSHFMPDQKKKKNTKDQEQIHQQNSQKCENRGQHNTSAQWNTHHISPSLTTRAGAAWLPGCSAERSRNYFKPLALDLFTGSLSLK